MHDVWHHENIILYKVEKILLLLADICYSVGDMSNNFQFKRSKIIATIGPSIDDYDKLVDIIKGGANCIRFNFSHSNNEERTKQMAMIRKASLEVGKPVAILEDLQGPRIRLGMFEGTVTLKAGEEWALVFDKEKLSEREIPLQYDLSKKVKEGERLYIADGRVRSKITKVTPGRIELKITAGGILTQRKGINVPDTDFGGDIITAKDIEDITFGAQAGVDYVALSFVQTAGDIKKLRTLLEQRGSNAKIVAKIETQVSIRDENLEAIIKESDAVMVARGDLAIETSPEIVPIVQQHILRLAQKHSKISIVATQMLASMCFNPAPTRAEVSDIANAVMNGADCVMLSDETASGQFPQEAVDTMKRVIMYTQAHMPREAFAYPEAKTTLEGSISATAVGLAERIDAQAIICETKAGNTAISIANNRPNVPVISITSDEAVARRLCLLYANKSFVRPNGENSGLKLAKELCEEGKLAAGKPVVIVSGKQPGSGSGLDTIRVRVL